MSKVGGAECAAGPISNDFSFRSGNLEGHIGEGHQRDNIAPAPELQSDHDLPKSSKGPAADGVS